MSAIRPRKSGVAVADGLLVGKGVPPGVPVPEPLERSEPVSRAGSQDVGSCALRVVIQDVLLCVLRPWIQVWLGEMDAQGSLPIHLPKVRINSLSNMS